ncbi:MAG: nickel pincer cofactor biosynthesis protein LarB [Nitrospiria bacterium]
MNRERLKRILRDVQSGEISLDTALGQLRTFPYESLGFATIDHHRSLRQGFPEVVYCRGKTGDQVLTILQMMVDAETPTLATRVTPALARKIQKQFPEGKYNRLAKTIVLRSDLVQRQPGEIAIVTAGTTDLPVAEEAKVTSELLGYSVAPYYDIGIAGLHRLLDQIEKVEKSDVIIVIAGMDGALPSVVGGLVGKPVIAVPTSTGYGAALNGLSSLLTMLNACAAGLAVVNIDNGFGAASLAHRILSSRR